MHHRLTPRHGFAVLAIVPLLGLTACGSDKKDSNRSGGYGSALSKDDFVKQANAACQGFLKEAIAAAKTFENPPTAANIRTVISIVDRANVKAKAIVPPKGELADVWSAFGTGNRAQVADYRRAAAALDRGASGAEVNPIEDRAAKDGALANAKLNAAGLKGCTTAPS